MFGLGMSPTPKATPELAQRLQEHLAYVAEEMRPYETGATYVNFLVTTFTGTAGRSKPRHAEAPSGIVDFSTYGQSSPDHVGGILTTLTGGE
jgi:hypothetical protein